VNCLSLSQVYWGPKTVGCPDNNTFNTSLSNSDPLANFALA